MENHNVKKAKLLICLVARHKGEKLVNAAKAAGARGGTLALGQSLGNSRLLQALSLGDVQQDVIFIVMTEEGPEVVNAIKQAAENEPKKFAGTAILLNVPEMFLTRAAKPASDGNDAAEEQGKQNTINGKCVLDADLEAKGKGMDSGYKLITVIVNSGYADDVMASARKAGATGGTIINARGTGTEEDVKFFGITLVPEKEMLIIVSPKDKVESIACAIATVPTLAAPGGGIIFTQNVEDFIILGQQKTWQE